MASIARKARRQKSQHNCQRKDERRRRRRTKKKQRRVQRPAPLPGRIARIVGARFAFFACAFTRPTWQRFVVLLCAVILTTGCRTINNLLRTVEVLAPGDPSSYHRVMSEKAMQSIDRVAQSQRDLSALTLTTSAAGLAKIKLELQAFRRRLIELSESEAAPDQVVQLNFHCFPLTSTDIEKEST